MRFGANNHQNHIYNGRKIGEGEPSFPITVLYIIAGDKKKSLNLDVQIIQTPSSYNTSVFHEINIMKDCRALWRMQRNK
jgi:hypothetical protein